ncbi:hypothetical protein [Serratia ureilytica]|uniref:hypothetical protein n=1 Tax=Serratia ureilytica TaxID=300181 RepID=UPI00313C91F2
MDNLSKPVVYIADCGTIVSESDPFFDDYKNPKPIYSQEYVSALEQKIAELEVLLDRNIKRAKKLGELLDTPVQLQNCDFESVAIMAHWCTDEQLKAWVKGVEHAKKQIRAAGFKVEGDE